MVSKPTVFFGDKGIASMVRHVIPLNSLGYHERCERGRFARRP